MFRVASLTVLVSGLLSLGAYHQPGGLKFAERPLPFNSTVSHFSLPFERPSAGDLDILADPDPLGNDLHILMLNYTAYDSMYVAKVRYLINKRLPGCTISDFWDGTTDELKEALAENQIVVVTYPANGVKKQVRAYGKVLEQFVRQGGAVVFSGTNQFGMLQQFGLIDLDFGYFCSDLEVHETTADHPVLKGTPAQFSMTNYTYPLDISDPKFVTLADIQDCPTMGYKVLGEGKVVYLGFEYYFDEVVSTRILENTLRWLAPPAKAPLAPEPVAAVSTANERNWTSRTVKRSEEVLYTGGGKPRTPAVDLKLYPNPYIDKAVLDLDLPRTSVVSVELTNESGSIVATPFRRQIVTAGPLRVDIPNVPAGVYFVKCQIDGQNIVRKVVKVDVQ